MQLDSKIAELEGVLRMLEREEQYRLGHLSEFDLDTSGKEHELQMLLHLPETPIDNQESCAVNRFEQEYKRIVTQNLNSVSGGGGGGRTEERPGKTETRRRTSVLPFRGLGKENSFTHTPLMARFSTDTDETNSDICPDLDTERSTVVERSYGTLRGTSSAGSSESLSSKLRAISDGGVAMIGDNKGKKTHDVDEEDETEIENNDQEDADETSVLAYRRSSSAANRGSNKDIPSTSETADKEDPDERTLITEMQDLQLRLLQLNGKANMIYYV